MSAQVSELRVEATPIEGLLVLHLPVHGDSRGWFKENWQRQKMVGLGLPDFSPVQHNVTHNETRGTTRGMHAEPWDKLVSVVSGRVFGAWVDLREGPGFGSAHTLELGPDTAVFVPRGVANGYQTLEEHTTYSYLVNAHWAPAARDSYAFVNLADPALRLSWPVPLSEAQMSEADRTHPLLSAVLPSPRSRTLVLGAGGQVGSALGTVFPDAVFLDRDHLDLTSAEDVAQVDWAAHDLVVNAAAFTGVDEAETPEGRRRAWEVNVAGVQRLVEAVRPTRAVLVHLSSDYVFDGSEELHGEDEPLSPLGVYGQTKAAGDALVGTLPRHYLLRTSWVVGEGRNFVATMRRLAENGSSPSVVDDQVGRPTFADEIARAVGHLTRDRAAYGTYNVTNGGETVSWAGLAEAVFELSGRSADDVTPVSTEEYAAGRAMAPRPRHSTLDLSRLESTGFVTTPWRDALRGHLA